MARASRQQRRARRAGATDSAYAEQQRERARARREQAETTRPEAEAPRPAEPAHVEPRRRGSFVRESYGELRKVEWPNRHQVVTGTVAVIIACAIVGAYLWVADLAFQNFVEKVLL